MSSREDIYAALWEKFNDLPGIVFSSRRLQTTSETEGKRPALFQTQLPEKIVQQRGKPPLRTLQAVLTLQIDDGSDPLSEPSQVINYYLDLIEEALTPDGPGGWVNCTLGGLVSHCWITEIDIDEGVLGEVALAFVLVEILMP